MSSVSGKIGYNQVCYWVFFMNEVTLSLSSDIVKLIAEIDEFKGRWNALKVLSPERLNALVGILFALP
jgi:hypothetical protein